MPMVGEDWVDEDEDHNSFESYYRKDEEHHHRLLRKLKRKLPLKMIHALEKEFSSHQSMLIAIVSKSDVKGKRCSGHDYTGASTPIRHVFVDASYCTYSESYTGQVFLYIGLGRYLQLQISG